MPKARRFAVALSFPGEHREYVERVARALLQSFGGEVKGKTRIFYDEWHEASIIGYAATRRLQEAYSDSDLVVPFYCADYRTKRWCGVELRVIEQLLFDEEFDRVLPFRFDMIDIPGSFNTDVFPLVTNRTPEDVARLIVERYNHLQEAALPPPAPAGRQGPVPGSPRRTRILARAFGGALIVSAAFVAWWAQSTIDQSPFLTPTPVPAKGSASNPTRGSEKPAPEYSELRGSLRDSAGRPVAQAVLTLEGGIARGVSDDLGEFGFQVPRPAGTVVRLRIQLDGKLRYDEYVTLPGPMTLTLR